MAINFKGAGGRTLSGLSPLKAIIAAASQKSGSISKPMPTNGAGLMSEREAAAYLGISVYTLQRIRKRGEIAFKPIGSRIRYTHHFLEDYLNSSEQSCKISASKSETSGFPSGWVPINGTPLASTKGPDKQIAAALAQKTFTKPKSSSPSS